MKAIWNGILSEARTNRSRRVRYRNLKKKEDPNEEQRGIVPIFLILDIDLLSPLEFEL
jgi:hypothetical protein